MDHAASATGFCQVSSVHTYCAVDKCTLYTDRNSREPYAVLQGSQSVTITWTKMWRSAFEPVSQGTVKMKRIKVSVKLEFKQA
jgi:hypothetical protein